MQKNDDIFINDNKYILELLYRRFLTSEEEYKEEKYCAYAQSEEKLESTLWEFAQGSVLESEMETIWKHVSDCNFCLNRMRYISKGLKEAESIRPSSWEDVQKLIGGKKFPPRLTVVLRFFKKIIELLNTDGFCGALEPVGATGIRSYSLDDKPLKDKIAIGKEMDGYSVDLLFWSDSASGINMNLKILDIEPQLRSKMLRVSVYGKNSELLESCSLKKWAGKFDQNTLTFKNLSSSMCMVKILGKKEVLGEVSISLREK